MTTTSFLASLRLHADLPLAFRLGSARTSSLAPGYHLTEVKRVAYETMDCGAMTHRWSETQFELWVPPLVGALPGRAAMPAGKFLQIVDRVQGTLPLDGEAVARVVAVLRRTDCAGQRRLQVPQHPVDPLELGQIARLEQTPERAISYCQD